MKRDVFQALADPTRRDIIKLLANKPLNINTLSNHFDATRAGVYKHIKVLEECGMLAIKQDGRERICEIKLKKLKEADKYISQFRQHWETRLEALESYLGIIDDQRKKKEKKKKAGKK